MRPGTKPENIRYIISGGLDEHYSPDAGLFGRGIYMADTASKSNQYSTPVRPRHNDATHLGTTP